MHRNLLGTVLLMLFAFGMSACEKNVESSSKEAVDQVDMMPMPVQAPSSDSDDAQDESVGMTLEGMFRYMADAALFRDCRSGKAFPVAMEAKYIDLERAYLDSDVEPGSEIMVRLRGRYLERTGMEGDRMEVQLIVDEVQETLPGEICEPVDHANLFDTYWKLLELQGEPVITPEDMREAHLILASSESRVHGFSGCNNFFGAYTSDGDSLSFSAMGATMMACVEGMETEQAFFKALGETSRATISGQFMTLYANDHPVARFEAVYL